MRSVKGQLLTRSVCIECIFVCYFLILHDIFIVKLKNQNINTPSAPNPSMAISFLPCCFPVEKYIWSLLVAPESSNQALQAFFIGLAGPPKLLPLQVNTQNQMREMTSYILVCEGPQYAWDFQTHGHSVTCSKYDGRWWMHLSFSKEVTWSQWCLSSEVQLVSKSC